MESELSLEKEDFYVSSKGYKLFSEKYHLKRWIC